MLTRAHLIVFGEVQGIGYRYFVKHLAQNLGLKGHVGNKLDGSVELDLEGEKKTIEECIQKLKHDHPWASVTGVEINFLPYKGVYSEFEIKL